MTLFLNPNEVEQLRQSAAGSAICISLIPSESHEYKQAVCEEQKSCECKIETSPADIASENTMKEAREFFAKYDFDQI